MPFVWSAWCGGATANVATTTSSASNADNVWYYWTTGTTTATTNQIVITSSAAWQSWTVSDGTACVYEDKRTPEQKAADEARFEAERQAVAERARQAEEARKAARDRARKLLLSMLTVQQREQLERELFFEVIAKHSRRRYRIRQGTHGNVRLLDDQGREVASYCAQPNGVPDEDAMLAQKLMIEHEEESFLRVANRRNIAA